MLSIREERTEGGLFGIGMKIESNYPHFIQGVYGLEVRCLATRSPLVSPNMFPLLGVHASLAVCFLRAQDMAGRSITDVVKVGDTLTHVDGQILTGSVPCIKLLI